MIFEGNLWQVHEALRKVHSAHEEYITHCSRDGIDPAPLRLLAHWTPPSQGNYKLNVDSRFLDNNFVLGACGVVRNSDGDWMFSFSHFENSGDALLAELRAMELGLELCLQRGMRCFLCESDCLEAITLVSTENINCLHSYAHTTLQITELMAKCEVDSWRHVVRETNKCVDFLAKEGAHSSCSTHWDSPSSWVGVS